MDTNQLITLVCPCLFGLESLVADEIRALGYENPAAQNGRVTLKAPLSAIARLNLGLRCAERVIVELGEFSAMSFEELFQGVKALPWENFIGREDAFPVKGWSLNSQLHSVPDCQAIIKKAVVERLKQKYRTDWFKETGPKLQIRFSILKDTVSVGLDTSGEGLHKRGYRAQSMEAPLKETLAAGMVKLSRPYADKPFYDPMCGSGTLLIEAAMLLRNMAPGLSRGFSAETWGSVDAAIWKEERERARAAVKPGDFCLRGYDIDPKAVALTNENARKAGLSAQVRAELGDIANFSPTDERGIVVCNPPYGERMLEIRQAEELYRTMGRSLLRLKGLHFYIISPSERFEELFGRKADKKRKLYNGMIRCNLFQYFRF